MQAWERWHEHFGFIVVSCERGDLGPVPEGVLVDSLGERGLRPGSATLEACLAILQSSGERRE